MNLEPSNRLSKLHGRVLAQVDQLLELARDESALALEAPKVSRWNIGQQVEHLLNADTTILDRWDLVERGEAPSSQGGLRWPGMVCLGLGWIPRGKGKAPEPTRPVDVSSTELIDGLLSLRRRISQIGRDLAIHETASWRSRHPYFGALSPAQWLRFMDVHHRHHLAIVRDIRKAS